MPIVIQDYLLQSGYQIDIEQIQEAIKKAIALLPTSRPSYVDIEANKKWWMMLYEKSLHFATKDQNFSIEILHKVQLELWKQHRRGDNLRLYGDVGNLFRLMQNEGFQLGVISNWDDTLYSILDRFGFLSVFSVVIVSSEIGKEKPNPEVFEKALLQANVLPSNCAYVGDDWECDVVAASKMGIQPIWIDRGKRATVIQSTQPDDSILPIVPIKLNSLSQILDICWNAH